MSLPHSAHPIIIDYNKDYNNCGIVLNTISITSSGVAELVTIPE
ncbi:hypothetical protein EZBTHKR_2301 [Elizabethkingia anophelis]|nr:hypothetical protein EZBTHKR_2301 [Elizabethkingia anophelis]